MLQDLITVTINNLNVRYGIDISLVEMEDDILLPTVNKRKMTIRFNPRMRNLFRLYKYGSADLIVKYYLMHKFMSYNMYDDAEHWVLKVESKLNKEIKKQKKIVYRLGRLATRMRDYVSQNDINLSSEDIRGFQILFVLLHEYSHALFTKCEDIKNKNYDRIKETVQTLCECDKYQVIRIIHGDAPWRARSFAKRYFCCDTKVKYTSLMTEFAKDERKVEEYACDLHAWSIILNILHYGGYTIHEQYIIFKEIIETLYYLESYKVMDDGLTGKNDMSKAEGVALFDSTRYSLLTYVVIMYLEGLEKGLGVKFDRKFSVFRWAERRKFSSVLLLFAEVALKLREGANIPDSNKSLKAKQMVKDLETQVSSEMV